MLNALKTAAVEVVDVVVCGPTGVELSPPVTAGLVRDENILKSPNCTLSRDRI